MPRVRHDEALRLLRANGYDVDNLDVMTGANGFYRSLGCNESYDRLDVLAFLGKRAGLRTR